MKTHKISVAAVREALGGQASTRNSKMPGASWGMTVESCKTGAALRHVKGSVCEKCYASKLERMRPSVKQGWTARLEALRAALSDDSKARDWINAMIQEVNRATAKAGEFFRWHDSGDLVSVPHLRMIVTVAMHTPNVRHWLPTKEAGIVKAYLRTGGTIPENLIVRVSAAMVDAKPHKVEGVHTCTVHKRGAAIGHACPAYQQGGKCGDCRACWDKTIANVSYPLH